jgi:hypothetical protein
MVVMDNGMVVMVMCSGEESGKQGKSVQTDTAR